MGTRVVTGFGMPTGSVTFSIDGTAQTPASVNASGIATFSTTALSVGNHTITAAYGGDGNFNTSDSTATPVTQTVNQASTTTAVSSSVNPSVFGQSVTFTGTVSVVSPGAGPRTGTLAFSVDGAPQTPVGINAAGIGTLAVSGLSTGVHV